MDANDPTRAVPAAPHDLELPERLAWRQGYRQAIEDLLHLESHGGEVSISDEIAYRLTIGRHVIE